MRLRDLKPGTRFRLVDKKDEYDLISFEIDSPIALCHEEGDGELEEVLVHTDCCVEVIKEK